jgi:DNA-binding CsgD family transcriptional regulator
VEIIESRLNDITSPFSHRLSSNYLALTPNELQVARLIRDGRTTKEIADIMDRSISAVEFHRKNIRKKLNLPNHRGNLQSHLQTYT